MKKRSFRLILFVVAIAMCGCEEFDPWADVDHGPFPALPEMPEKVNNNNYIYVTHEATLSNRKVRNYSICFDKTKYAARWIAYPLHTCYRGSTDRSYQSSQVWPYDPLIVSSYQAVGKGGYNGYTRGHQIPSADRTATRELNEQTFYMSNMTPQAYDFNSGIWLDLENKVRGYMCNDTIYVVTGAHWENTSRYAGKYPIPTHYYKV
ncbi:MAG: DNA/RNA non-specific endonuclease, partial [Paludibacteraceae bacterium]|nr:DNA/RNA non-specific endonuclease [Paludibacteraceae bacterium]